MPWVVVGGDDDKGGIIVKEGKSFKSAKFETRLARGSVLEELELIEERLHYKLVSGKGPEEGWVSLEVGGKVLVEKKLADKKTTEKKTTEKKGKAASAEPMDEAQALEARKRELDVELARRNAADRCKRELEKPPARWQYITTETVINNHEKTAPGMFYGIDFPWTEEMFRSPAYGAKWLTKAFHVAGTLPKDNAVSKIVVDEKVRITTGSNGGKFLFDVEYKKPSPDLHTKLFAKIPHPMSTMYRTDRLSSSVNKQPTEYEEINNSRLLEAVLPIKIPKFYFGDISNETSNWILITQQIPFMDHSYNKRFFTRPCDLGRPALKPYEIEGPYDKCVDWTLRSEPSEYYYLLLKAGAKIAGYYKTGRLGDVKVLNLNFDNWGERAVESWGVNPYGCTGSPPAHFKMMYKQLDDFVQEVAPKLFPAFVHTQAFRDKFRKTIFTLNAHMAESNWWRNRDQDYIALCHQNLNVDNAFYYRDENGELNCGIFDFGPMCAKDLRLWSCLYCGDWDVLTVHIDKYIQCFIDSYAEHGGPTLDHALLKVNFILCAYEQMFGLIGAIPHIYRMCNKKNFATIEDRWDPRIAENIDGKSTERLYIHVMNNILRITEEWKGDQVVAKWTEDVAVAVSKIINQVVSPKNDQMIYGE